MAIFQKPEDVIGMKPEELKAKLESAVTKDDLKAVAEEIGKQYTSQFDALRAELAKITTKPAEPAPEPDPEDPTTAVLTDPDGFIQKRTKPLMDAQMETRAQMQEMRARQDPRFSRIFAKYGADLVKLAAGFTPAQRSGDNFWEWHVRTFLGDKYVKGELQAESYPSLIGTSSVAPDGGEPDDPNRGMDPEVVAWLKARGKKIEDISKINTIMNKNGDPISLGNFKSGNA